MTITPSLAAIAGASLVATIVAFVVRPAQLAPHPASTPSIGRDVVGTMPPQRTQTLVYVAGAVLHPGVYAVGGDARARDALAKAGGATRDADLVAVNLAAHVADGEEIAVPRQGEAPHTAGRSTQRKPATSRRGRRRPGRESAASADASAAAPIDLNTAGAAVLAQLPGIGPTLAQRIVDFRTLNGPFASVDELADVAGITAQRLAALTPRLVVSR